MEKTLIKDLVRAVKGKFIYGDPRKPVFSISTDTRSLRSGDIFFALKGKNYDGHKFIFNAIKEGASGLVVAELPKDIDSCFSDFSDIPSIIQVEDTIRALGDFAEYYRTLFSPVVIAVTGSNGKTTTKELLYALLSQEHSTLANIGSFNNAIGLPLTLFNLSAQHKYCVLELGISLPDEIDRLIEISKPDIGIITNIGRTHLEFLGNTDGVFQEKRKLVERLPLNGKAILNIDDFRLKELTDSVTCEVITFGLDPAAKVRAADVEATKEQVRFKLITPDDEIKIKLPLRGRFNVYNALAAASVGYAIGLSVDTIRKRLEKSKLPKMRMEKHKTSNGSIIINDAYNANPDSMRESILSFVRMYPDRKKILVLGDMLELGEYSVKEHMRLGEFMTELTDIEPFDIDNDVIYCYGKEVQSLLDGIKKELNAEYFKSSEDLIARLKHRSKDIPVILFKASRGIGLEEIVNRLVNADRTGEFR